MLGNSEIGLITTLFLALLVKTLKREKGLNGKMRKMIEVKKRMRIKTTKTKESFETVIIVRLHSQNDISN